MATSRDEIVHEYNVPENCIREKELKWNGWGYRDSFFYLDEKDQVSFSGKRYDISGKVLPQLRPWMIENLGIDLRHTTPSQPSFPLDLLPPPTLNYGFLDWLREQKFPFSTDKTLRLNRSHGHTVYEIMNLREGRAGRVPDLVVWPRNQSEVEKVVQAADRLGVAIIPIGGGTSVSSALECPSEEGRSLVSLDMCLMSRILWVDALNLTARAEAGIVGLDLEEQLNAKGYTMGHEPDSIEFSTLGGWVATRASGMKKNKYGNIEDLLVHVTIVTPRGTIQKSCQVPRISAGPDIHQFILGSEGTLGVVTEVSFKICPQPPCKRYGSILFPSFEPGVNCLREVARQKCAPASIRLVDNEQFLFGQALKPAAESYWRMLTDLAKKQYVTRWKGFKPKEMCAATLVLEGTEEEVELLEKRIYEIAVKFGGLPAGAENGRYGYMLTFAIAYLRDLGFEYSCLGESFETSVPWNKVFDLCRNVKELLKRETKRHGIDYPTLCSCRVTQLYDSGACVYFYYGFNYRGLPNPVEVYHDIETAARNEILACGGSISHHHGVGKLRKEWLPRTVGELGLSAMQAVKTSWDPRNVFAAGNLFTVPKL